MVDYKTDNRQMIIARVWELLHDIPDPEIPVISITDLGIVRDVDFINDTVIISITPTYSGCPAMDMISMNIRLHMISAGFNSIEIRTVLSPAWTTEWMTEDGKDKLLQYGIAPPNRSSELNHPKECPHCKSENTKEISYFGSTACKSLFKCEDCHEVFDYFKCH